MFKVDKSKANYHRVRTAVFENVLFFHEVTSCILNLILLNLTLSIFLGQNLFSSLPPNMIFDLTIYPSPTIRCFGFLLNSSLSFKPQILSVASSCFFHLSRIKQISSYLNDASFEILVCSLVFLPT